MSSTLRPSKLSAHSTTTAMRIGGASALAVCICRLPIFNCNGKPLALRPICVRPVTIHPSHFNLRIRLYLQATGIGRTAPPSVIGKGDSAARQSYSTRCATSVTNARRHVQRQTTYEVASHRHTAGNSGGGEQP